MKTGWVTGFKCYQDGMYIIKMMDLIIIIIREGVL